MDNNQRVVCSAILYENGICILGVRHFDIQMHNTLKLIPDINWAIMNHVQGFIDNYGKFLTREEAYVVAKEQNQIIRGCGKSTKLYSENLY